MRLNNIKSISVVIPVLNEQKILNKLIKQIAYNLKKYFKYYEIIIVDDSRNYLLTQKILNKFNYVKFYKNKKKGLLNSIKNGVYKANSNNILLMDGDLSHDLSALNFINKNYLKYDLINFSRFLKKNSDKRTFKNSGPLKYYSFVLNKILKHLINSKISDYTSGFIFFKRNKIKKNFFKGDYGEYAIYFLYKCLKSKLKFSEFPCYFYDREIGSSKTGLTNFKIISRGKKYIFLVLKILLLKN
tara:strand:- start:693 stop:1421 length:729 start_codon:yes stop_codon:yes gene_type:complete